MGEMALRSHCLAGSLGSTPAGSVVQAADHPEPAQSLLWGPGLGEDLEPILQ